MGIGPLACLGQYLTGRVECQVLIGVAGTGRTLQRRFCQTGADDARVLPILQLFIICVFGETALLRQQLPDTPLQLHLLGGGSLEARLRNQVQARGLGQSVHFHGRLDDAGMAAVLARCKISVSVPASDATSVAMLESMACGLAVVASDLPANRQWINPALLVPAGDAQALAQVLQRLASDDEHARQAGERNAERIALDGDRKTQMDHIDHLYRELLP